MIFDPLDGSSNIDSAFSVGTTFSILPRPMDVDYQDVTGWVLQPGSKQVAAGYVVYGSSTVLVYSAGNGVHGFTLDPMVGAFLSEPRKHPDSLAGENIIRSTTPICIRFPAGIESFWPTAHSGRIRARNYGVRYVGSMVADVHRTLLKGGIFLYPLTATSGRKTETAVRSNPIAFLWNRPAAWRPMADDGS